ncbi:hypothetical protein AA105894_2629 [Asaia spathodeae NBRC 105894]|nr:hypothetical protein AA105894_2629 [Asaia spathodeae NBRC 105894]
MDSLRFHGKGVINNDNKAVTALEGGDADLRRDGKQDMVHLTRHGIRRVG